MAENTYTNELKQALDAKIEQMDQSELKQLKDEFKLLQTAFQTIYSILLKKGLIHEDPYKLELKISDVTTPSESTFAETEKLDQMSIRLSQYESYLDFLNNYYHFSVDFLTMGRIKRIVSLAKYFNYASFTETCPQINTKYFAEIVGSIRKGSDKLSIDIINESISQLDKSSRKIFSILKSLTLIHREKYKLEVRTAVMPSLKFEQTYAITHKEDVLKKVKQRLIEVAPKANFYPELITEIINEDFGSDGLDLKDEVLKNLEVKAGKDNKKSIENNFKIVLLDGIRVIVGTGFQIEDAIGKLEENQELLNSLDKSFFSKIKKAIRELMGKKGEHIVHSVEYFDAVTTEHKTENLDFTVFCQEGKKKSQILLNLSSRSSVAYRKLESSHEEIIYKYLSRNIEELQSMHKKLVALDDFYANSLNTPEIKNRIRSIKIELGSIKNAIIKANQKKHEYLAQKEEMEQMKRLGIKEV